MAVSRLLILTCKIANNRCKVKFNFGVFLGYCCKKSKLFKRAKLIIDKFNIVRSIL